MADENTNTETTDQLIQDTNFWLEKVVTELQKVDHSAVAGLAELFTKVSQDLQRKLDKVAAAVDVKPTFNPDISVSAPNVHVDAPDLKPLQKLLDAKIPLLAEATRAAIADIPATDLSGVETALEKLLTTTAEVRDRRIPLPQFPTTLKVVNPDGSLVGGTGQLVSAPFNEIVATYPSATVEVYTYKQGAAIIVGTVTVTYTDSTKAVLSSVVAS